MYECNDWHGEVTAHSSVPCLSGLCNVVCPPSLSHENLIWTLILYLGNETLYTWLSIFFIPSWKLWSCRRMSAALPISLSLWHISVSHMGGCLLHLESPPLPSPQILSCTAMPTQIQSALGDTSVFNYIYWGLWGVLSSWFDYESLGIWNSISSFNFLFSYFKYFKFWFLITELYLSVVENLENIDNP